MLLLHARPSIILSSLVKPSLFLRGHTRSFRFSTPCAAQTAFTRDPARLRAGTIVPHDPSTTTGDYIISLIEPPTALAPRSFPRTSNGVLLCTRAFAALASDADFLRNFVTRLTGSDELSQTSPALGSVNLLSAVIDHVPNPASAKSSSNVEGVTYLFDIEGRILDLGNSNEANSTWQAELSATDESGLLSLRVDNLSRFESCVTLQLPLANTLFTTGTRSTMVLSQWQMDQKNSKVFVNTGAVSKSTFTLTIPDAHRSQAGSKALDLPDTFDLHLPLKPLTPLRLVADCTGNVVRRVVDGYAPYPSEASSKGPFSASLELEQAVAKYFSDQDLTPTTIPVWGLVGPPKSIKMMKPITPDQRDPAFLVRQSATLHRVLSGGGGWGNKTGLISLDHHTDYAQSSSSNPLDFSCSDDSFKTQFGGAIVSKDDFLKFYTLDTTTEAVPSTNSRTASTSAPTIQIQVGVSQALDEYASSGDSSIASTSDETDPTRTEAFEDQFGALSESGFAFSEMSPAGRLLCQSKIDVPNARLSFTSCHPASRLPHLDGNIRPVYPAKVSSAPVEEASHENMFEDSSQKAKGHSRDGPVPIQSHFVRSRTGSERLAGWANAKSKDSLENKIRLIIVARNRRRTEIMANKKIRRFRPRKTRVNIREVASSTPIRLAERTSHYDTGLRARFLRKLEEKRRNKAEQVKHAEKLLQRPLRLAAGSASHFRPLVDATRRVGSKSARQGEIFELFDEIMGQDQKNKTENTDGEYDSSDMQKRR